jgi:hypothetical protein
LGGVGGGRGVQKRMTVLLTNVNLLVSPRNHRVRGH